MFFDEEMLLDLRLNVMDKYVDKFVITEATYTHNGKTKKLNLDINKVNIYGGAVSMGHPIGASGARIICTLLNSLIREDKRLGVASICIGGGEASSILVKRLS